MKPFISFIFFSIAGLKGKLPDFDIYFCLTEVSECFVIDSHREGLNCAACSFGSAASFSQYWRRDDVDESRVGGLKVPVKTLILVLGQNQLCPGT